MADEAKKPTPGEKPVKPKWYEPAQVNAVKWLEENSDKYMLNWQKPDKALAIDCYTMIAKGSNSRDTEKVIFTYSKETQVMSVYRSVTSEVWVS